MTDESRKLLIQALNVCLDLSDESHGRFLPCNGHLMAFRHIARLIEEVITTEE